MDGEQPEKPRVPADLSAPGLIYRYRPPQRRFILSWSPRSDLTARGFLGKTTRLWPGDSVPPQQSEPTRAEWEVISAWCVRYHAEQLLWSRGGAQDDPKSLFDGTIASLVTIYETRENSPYKQVRFETHETYAKRLNAIKTAIGKVRVAHVTFDDITTWQREFADPGDGGKPMKARAANLIGQLRQVFLFGALVLPKSAGCHDVCDIFSKMREGKMMKSGFRRRHHYMTAVQCRLLRLKAHELGRPSVALEQAFAFELGLRQKDVIGEWIPIKWPGLTDVHWGSRKWLVGIRWEEIDENLILSHRLSKSIHGKEAVMEADEGKLKAWDLTACPMVMDELRRIAGKEQFTRADLPLSGPLIVCEEIRRPWTSKFFGREWRKIATAAGIPASVQNRDSRPGAATEAKLAGAVRDDIQRELGHSKGETTEIYLREQLEEQRKLARLRTEKRKL